MSDGDNATPGRPASPGPGGSSGDNQWLTRSARPAPGAAPWERSGISNVPDDISGDVSGDAGDHHRDEPEAAHHSGAVTVADLIAKVSGTRSDEEPTRHRAEPDPPLPAYSEPARAAGRDHDPATEVMAPVALYDSELPILTDARRPEKSAGASRAGTTHAPHRGRHTAKVVGRVAAALIAICALAMTGAAWQWQSSKNRSLNQVSALDLNSRDILDPNAQFGDENFLIVGVDSRIGQNSDMGAGDTEDAAGARSDTVMLVNIPADRKRVVAVSFPRDLAITPIKCEPWNAETGAYGPIYDEDTESYGPDEVYTETKLNSAYSFGGPKCLVKVIQKLSGLSINRFMAVDFSGFAKMVDAVGGVEVCSTTPLEDYELGTVLANAGRQTIDGHTALQYVRARQVTTETNGDYGRIKRQQLFLSSLLRSLISKEVFFSLSKLNNVVNMFIDDSYVDNIQTKDLVDLGQSLQGVNAGRITFVTVPTGETDSEGNEPPREEDMRALFDAIINDDPLPEEKNADNTPVPETPTSSQPAPNAATGELVDAVTTSPGDITVRVSNSTGESGLATVAANELQQHGFNITDPDDYPGPLASTTVFFSAGNEQAAATVASSFANPTIERVSGMGTTIRVVLGSDFASVAPPTPSGSPIQVHVLKGTSSEPTHLPEDLTVTNAADTTCE